MGRERTPTLKHWIEYAGWRLIASVLWLMPRRAMVFAADALGWLAYRILRMRRRDTDQHLAIAFPEVPCNQRARIGLRCYQNQVLTFFEFVQPFSPFYGVVDLFYEAEGCAHLHGTSDAVPVLVTAHMGNWEALAMWVAKQGVAMCALAKDLHNPLINTSVLKRRSNSGVEVLRLPVTPQQIAAQLRSGKCVAILGDQDARRTGIFVEFFGRPASTAAGAAVMARRLKRPILAGFCSRDRSPHRRLAVHVFPPIYPNADLPLDEDVRRMTEAHVGALEEIIRAHPESYFWLHRRWKTQPKREQLAGARSQS